jgi:ribosomal protein S18 acetylase RimI-like enzyme
MNRSTGIEIRRLSDESISDIVRIHRSGLGYSLNSRLGNEHLAFLYRRLLVDPNSYVGVAYATGRPIGVVSGTTDLEDSKSRLLRSMPRRRIFGVAAKLLVRPGLVLQWGQGRIIDAPVRYEGEEVAAGLTAIAVQPAERGAGAGRLLVRALETFLAERRIHYYRLDTLTKNAQAREFYKKLGFQELGVRAGSMVLVKAIGQ